MIKAILFDYGGVLCPGGGKDDVPKALSLIYGIEQENVQVDDLHQKLLLGDITDKEFVDELNHRHPGSARLTKKLFFEKVNMLRRNQEVYSLAAKLRSKGIKTGILSNAYAMTAELLKENGQYEGFEPVVLSCYEHLKKPEPQFYKIAINKLSVEPNEILFVDDQEKCIPPAETLGLKTLLVSTEEQIITGVKQILKLENNLTL